MLFKNFQFPVISLLVLLLSIFSCNCGRKKYNVDVSGIKVNIEIERFDKDLLAINRDNYYRQVHLLLQKYPDFFPFYLQQIMGIPKISDTGSALKDSLLNFLSVPYYKKVFDTTEIEYNNMDDIKLGLEEGMKHYRYYFPGIPIPKVLTYVNGPRSFTYGDSILAIGLDNYLGANYHFYYIVQPPIPDFIIRRLSREYMVPNAMQVLATNYFPFRDDGKKLLDEMIYNGKIDFLLEHILPDTPDSIIVNYRAKDIKWCNENEPEIWKYFVKNSLIYETDQLSYKKFVTDGPNTTGMPPDAPGNIGSWVGWRIVQKYAEKHPELSLKQIMLERDSQKILSESKYKP